MDRFFELPKALLKQHNFVHTEAHDSDDEESSDFSWLEYVPYDVMCEGTYLSVSRLISDADYWYAAVNDANTVGGHHLVCEWFWVWRSSSGCGIF